MDNIPEVTRAEIVGVNIPFWDLVRLLVKYAFASITTLLIVAIAFSPIILLLNSIGFID